MFRRLTIRQSVLFHAILTVSRNHSIDSIRSAFRQRRQWLRGDEGEETKLAMNDTILILV